MESEAVYGSSVQKIIESVPIPARSTYSPILKTFYDKAIRYLEIKAQVSRMKSMQTVGKQITPLNSIKDPKLQVSEEFLKSGGTMGLDCWQKIPSAVQLCRTNVFDYYIKTKVAEANYYSTNWVGDDAISTLAKNTILQVADNCCSAHGAATLNDLPSTVKLHIDKLDKQRSEPFRLVLSLAAVKVQAAESARNKKIDAKTAAESRLLEERGDMNKNISLAVEAHFQRRMQSKLDKSRIHKVTKQVKRKLTKPITGKRRADSVPKGNTLKKSRK